MIPETLIEFGHVWTAGPAGRRVCLTCLHDLWSRQVSERSKPLSLWLGSGALIGGWR